MFEIKIIKKIALNFTVWRVFFFKKTKLQNYPTEKYEHYSKKGKSNLAEFWAYQPSTLWMSDNKEV